MTRHYSSLNWAPKAGHAPALMPVQPGQPLQPQMQVRYQSPGPKLVQTVELLGIDGGFSWSE